MNNPKCPSCGLVNFASAHECKRCGALLSHESESYAGPAAGGDFDEFEGLEEEEKPRRSLKRKVLAGFGTAALLLFVWYISLLETSTAVTFDEKQAVHRAVDIIERKGFTKDAFLLRRLASYRTTDNWWNNYVGHADAYAATNFPFQVVTLYPPFFNKATDDTERAAILLHEARHLAGAGEERAFAGVWRDRVQLGYTRDKYGHTDVWRNVSEFTMKYAPEVFRCGTDGQQDCAELSEQPRP